MDPYIGTIIAESLENKELLTKLKILSTRVESVTDKHCTPWLQQWTLHKVEIPEIDVQRITEKISKAIDSKQPGSWYADYKNSHHHYIIFKDKIFYIDRINKAQYDAAKEYALSLGIPAHQVDFHSDVIEWKR